jgi:dCTP diphosphatase
MDLEAIAAKIRAFRDERDWAQFHNPKDMAIAISIEASELLEHFLWKSPEELDARISEKREHIEEESYEEDPYHCRTEWGGEKHVC